MRNRLSCYLLAVALLAPSATSAQTPPAPLPMRMTTSAFPDGGVIPARYTQAGQSISPALTWTNVPAGTSSFVLLFHDPDTAPERNVQDVTHWIVWNIPATATGMDEGITQGALLANGAVQGKNRRGANGYMGPGAGANGPEHHYTFELWALDTKLALGPDATRAEVMKAMDGHILGKAAWEGRFHRPQ